MFKSLWYEWRSGFQEKSAYLFGWITCSDIANDNSSLVNRIADIRWAERSRIRWKMSGFSVSACLMNYESVFRSSGEQILANTIPSHQCFLRWVSEEEKLWSSRCSLSISTTSGNERYWRMSLECQWSSIDHILYVIRLLWWGKHLIFLCFLQCANCLSYLACSIYWSHCDRS